MLMTFEIVFLLVWEQHVYLFEFLRHISFYTIRSERNSRKMCLHYVRLLLNLSVFGETACRTSNMISQARCSTSYVTKDVTRSAECEHRSAWTHGRLVLQCMILLWDENGFFFRKFGRQWVTSVTDNWYNVFLVSIIILITLTSSTIIFR